MNINDAVTAIESFLRTYDGGGTRPASYQVRPSGDEVDVIKVWVDLGSAQVDTAAWASACEAAIRKAVPAAKAFQLAVRVETD